MATSALVWFRRDLRVEDQAALYHALEKHSRVHCAFIFDTEILDDLPDPTDRRVAFIHSSIKELDAHLRERGGGLIVRRGRARQEIPSLAVQLGVSAVFANRDYEPKAIERDADVELLLSESGIGWRSYKDQVVFEQDEVLTKTGAPYSVFTPYKNAWLAGLASSHLESYPVYRYTSRLAPPPIVGTIPSLAEIGFAPAKPVPLPCGTSGARQLFDSFTQRIDDYHRTRDFPALKGPSYLSTHLRFGTISVRELAAWAWHRGGPGAMTWLGELIWRDFYHMILAHHPSVVAHCFRPQFDALAWDDAPDLFAAWCEGRTGYPLVDAAMRQLNQSGYMHNRLRMVAASFLTKDLGIDWRAGERYFAQRLNDYDLAANNGGWQWAASTGCDAQPYFRIFNPVSQSMKFDADGRFIRRYVPELSSCSAKAIHAPWLMDGADQRAAGVHIGGDYPQPIVDHASARLRTLARFKAVK
jgi:deoxyribodipyrimidine photo-lyase